jgi:hypothetical protein
MISLSALNDKQRAMIPEEIRRKMGIDAQTTAEVVAAKTDQLEEEIAQEIISLLMHAGVTTHRANPKRKSSITVGFPDLWFSVGGLACSFEVKAAWGRLSNEQETCIAQMRKESWRVEVVTSAAHAMSIFYGWKLVAEAKL